MQSMQLTDWLVVIFIVAIVVVLLDGVRRKLAERRSRVVLKIDKNLPKDDIDPEELPNSELPNGGARTLVRDGQPAPSLRTLKTKRKFSFRNSRTDLADAPGVRAVPVLLDAVDVEEERIEHTNVFADYSATDSFEADDFASDDGLAPESSSASARAPLADAQDAEDDDDELIDGLDEEYEEDAMLGEETVARKQTGYMDTRYQGRDDDEYEDDDEELEEDEEEELEEFEDDIETPDEFADDDLDDDDDEELDDDEEDDDDLDDEDDDDFDDDDEEDEEDEEEEDEDLEELEGLPEDEWGSEEETDVLVDDYESEPVLMQGAYDKAATQFSRAANQLDKAASHAASQLDKVASHAASQFDKAASHAVSQLDKAASHAATQLDRAASHAASHFNRPERQQAPRIEPGFGDDAGDLGSDSFADTTFTEHFSASWPEESTTLDATAARPVPGAARSAAQAAAVKPLPGKKEQGELFREAAAPREAPRDENRLLAALQKAVPARAQPAPEPAPAPQEVIIINVMARPGQPIYGSELLAVLLDQGMRLGDMSIFHRHADSNGSGYVMFSMANMVKPGTFDLATMDHFTTPGVSFFLQMPNKLGNMACFDKMLSAAVAVREAFDADLKDEHRSVFTRQTVEHCRQRVRDFELKLLSRK